ncbi:hypothetical protein [Micromonospora coxensis]|uniref:Glycosyl hydrolase family 49 n=1 Tax=Micromonospora coxensis TaxID=356852 RepID=A0A1C5GX51_9ACTN|nr:hypothetical protein [Micromonospora coxensis]SCG37721.1 Glycosyl hydrolase family 49 [Micromonospora coxensis]
MAGAKRALAALSATAVCVTMSLLWRSAEASDRPAEPAADSSSAPAGASPGGFRARFRNGSLASLNADNSRGNADGVRWTASTATLSVDKAGTYLIDGIVAANIQIAATGTVTILGGNKQYDDRDVDSEAERTGFFNRRRGGDGGVVGVGPQGVVDAPGYLDSALVGVFVPNPVDPTNPASVIQATSDNRATINLRNFTIFGDGHNAVRPLQGNAGGTMSDLVVVTPAFGVSASRPRGSGGGGVEIGQDGLLRDSFLKVGDDAIKPKKRGAVARNIRVQLQDSGTAVQFGWSPAQAEGDVVVDGVVVNGRLSRSEVGDYREGAGESVVGGSIGGNEANYVARNIRVEPDLRRSFPNIVRLRFPERHVVRNVDLDLRLSAETELTAIPGTRGTHSFVLLRPDSAAPQPVTLTVERDTTAGTARPVQPTGRTARFFLVTDRVALHGR